MATNHKPQRLKFKGEESFICKKGKKKYLMATGEGGAVIKLIPDQPAAPLPTQPIPTDGGVMPAIEPVPPKPVPVPTPPPIKVPVDDTGLFPLPPVAAPPVVLTFPDWASLDCATIKADIADLNNILMTSKFDDATIAAYQQQIELGQKTFYSKCGVVIPPAPPTPAPTPAPPVTTITTTGVPVIATTPAMGGGGGGRLGGGGGGGAAAEEQKPAGKKAAFQWWWLLVAAGALYMLTRKKKK